MRPRFIGSAPACVIAAVFLAFASGASTSPVAGAGQARDPRPQTATDPIGASAMAQIDALIKEKESRSPAEQKIDSQLIYAMRMSRGQAIAAGVQTLEVDIPRETDGRAVVDVIADVNDGLLSQFRAMGAEVLYADARYDSARLSVSLDQLDSIAALPAVIFIQPKQEAMTSRKAAPAGRFSTVDPSARAPRRRAGFDRAALAKVIGTALQNGDQQGNFTAGQGTKATEGEFVHRAYAARGVFNTTGAGLKIGVLSDGVRNLATSQALGDLGPVTVLGAPAPCPSTSTCDEGTAMLEIVHDMAPGAQLYFASAFVSITDFAQKIRDLQAAGCTIIVDDVGYFVETPFQDGQSLPAGVTSNTNAGVVIQAVKDVAALGVMYFSSAANSGNLNDATSGTWEGDFADGGAAAAPIPIAGRLHNFAVAQAFNVLTVASTTAPITLHWADPLGASNNDYDIFRLNSTGVTLLAASTNLQNGTQDPYEQITATGAAAGQRVVVVKSNAAAARFLHVSTNRGRLSVATAGETHGHAATTHVNTFGVAAVDATTASPNPFTGTNVVETFSSDGPRRIFFTASNAAFTPGNFTSTGGLVLQKPDFAAADGVSVTGVGFFPSPFFGTSAAAPHAAAIAALIKSAAPGLSGAQIRTALTSSAIDIEAPGVDRDAGAGIIMAFQALQAAGVTGRAFLTDSAVAAVESPGNGNGVINVGEGATMNVTLTNLGPVDATNVTATLTSLTPGVTVTLPGTSTYPIIFIGGSGVNFTPFRFTVAGNAPCPLTANFQLTLNYTGGAASPTPIVIPVVIGPQMTITTTLDGTAPGPPAGVVGNTGLQLGRLTRNGLTSTCVAPKAFPGFQTQVGSRRFDSYSFATCAENTGGCATVSMGGSGAINMFSVAYSPAFSSGDPSVGYAADPGFSSDALIPYQFSVASGGGQKATVVVHEVDPGGAVGTLYQMTITGLCAGGCATPNQVPIARTRNVTVPAGAGGTAAASIDNGSSDPDGDPLTITQSPPGPYPVGTTVVLLTVMDPKGATSQATGNVTVTPSPPAAPTGVFAAPGGFTRIRVKWTAAPGASTYNIKRSTTPGTEVIVATGVIGTTYLDTQLVKGQIYFYKVSAVSNGESADSAEAFAVTLNKATPLDFDGDGKTDLTVYRQATRSWNTNQSNTGFTTDTAVQWGLAGDVPVPGDYDGDGIADPAIYRPSNGSWFVTGSTVNGAFLFVVAVGLNTDLPVPADYDGDGKTDPAVYRPSTGTWFVLKSTTGYASPTVIGWGLVSDVPVPGDYDGDGKADLAVYRPSSGTWFVLNSSTGFTTSSSFALGVTSGLPVPGDYDADGKTDPAIFEPATGTWFRLTSSTGYTAATPVQWGLPGDLAVPGDYDFDGRIDPAIYRTSTGTWFVLTSTSNFTVFFSRQWGLSDDLALPLPIGKPHSDTVKLSDVDGDGKADLTVFRPSSGQWLTTTSSSNYVSGVVNSWGLSTDVPVPGDYDGDGKADRAVFRPSGGGWFILTSSSNYTASIILAWGLSSDTPVPGDYDGDGKTDVAVYRPSTAQWFILFSSSNFLNSQTIQWGLSGDIPVPNDYDGDGKTDPAVFQTGAGMWQLLSSASNYTTSTAISWGLGSDTTVPGDYDRDGRGDLAVWRPSTGQWFLLFSGTNFGTSQIVSWGLSSDRAVPGDFDGDGRTDLGVFRPSTGEWFVLTSSTNYAGVFSKAFGLSTDIPILRR